MTKRELKKEDLDAVVRNISGISKKWQGRENEIREAVEKKDMLKTRNIVVELYEDTIGIAKRMLGSYLFMYRLIDDFAGFITFGTTKVIGVLTELATKGAHAYILNNVKQLISSIETKKENIKKYDEKLLTDIWRTPESMLTLNVNYMKNFIDSIGKQLKLAQEAEPLRVIWETAIRTLKDVKDTITKIIEKIPEITEIPKGIFELLKKIAIGALIFSGVAGGGFLLYKFLKKKAERRE